MYCYSGEPPALAGRPAAAAPAPRCAALPPPGLSPCLRAEWEKDGDYDKAELAESFVKFAKATKELDVRGRAAGLARAALRRA